MIAPESPLLREQEVDASVAGLMPELREMIAGSVREALSAAEAEISARICDEAELRLRRLLQQAKPK